MAWVISGVLVLFWLLGLFSPYTLGNYNHVLLLLAAVVVGLRLLQGRSAR